MGVAQSLLSAISDTSPSEHSGDSKLNNNNNNTLQHQQRQSSDLGLSWISSKMQRDMTAKFTELELLSLRQVFQKLKETQDRIAETKPTNETGDEAAAGAEQEHEGAEEHTSSTLTESPITDQRLPAKKKLTENMKAIPPHRSVPGITEAVFEDYLGFQTDATRVGKLFFRSFYNLSVYPDHPNQLPGREVEPRYLTVRDLIKPLSLYCQKVREDDTHGLIDAKPLRAIFESFAEPTPPTSGTTPANIPMSSAHTSENLRLDTEDSLPLRGSLKKSKTMEDSLKDLTLHANFEWNPEDDDHVESGPKVKALDLVEILEGLFWLIQRLILDNPEYPHADPSSGQTSPTTGSNTTNVAVNSGTLQHRHRARSIVEHMIQYGRSSSHLHEPIDLTAEMIDYGAFSKYVDRNMPRVFNVLSQYFYSLFLIGNTMRRTSDSSTTGPGRKLILPGVSSIPQLASPSSILTPENLALISWFLPDPKLKPPTLTNLYSGSKHGFSMNQFEVHVCKYPAPTLLLLSVVRQRTPATPTVGGPNRRQSISFGTVSNRHRHSISSNSPPYSVPWGIDTRRSSFEKLTGRSPTTPISTGTVLNTIMDDVATGDPSNKGEGLDQSDPLATSPSPSSALRSSTDTVHPHTPATPTKRSPRERMVLGAYVTETWKVSKAGWGNDSFSLFELSPCFEVFPARKQPGSSSSSMGASLSGPPSSARSLPGGNTSKSHHGRSSTTSRDYPTASPSVGSAAGRSSSPATVAPERHYIHFLKNAGVGFGGQESESCMLYMDDNLQFGNYRQDFAGGNVYQSAGGARQQGFQVEFEIVECEVWGLGGAEAKARQQKEWDFEQREANKRATVYLRSNDGEQDIDRDLLEMAGVIDPDRGHRHARRQSAV